MREFNYNKYADYKWSNNILSLTAALHEYKAKQDILLNQTPAVLSRLENNSKILSTEASNAIEGIRTTTSRFKKLYNNEIKSVNRAEEEILGYRDVLNIIYENYEYIPIRTGYILQLHRDLFKYSPKELGGSFKNNQNYINATDEYGRTFTVFKPLDPFETPIATENLCAGYNEAADKKDVDPLLLIPIFIHDFLCIHPFSDGNGRMSRLLTTLMLLRNDYMVGKYISLENMIAQNKDQYYNSLSECQEGWHENYENVEAFIEYILSILLSSYRELESRISDKKTSSADIVKNALKNIYGRITKSELARLCPSISAKAVEKAIKQLVDDDVLIKMGSGKNTYYIKK